MDGWMEAADQQQQQQVEAGVPISSSRSVPAANLLPTLLVVVLEYLHYN
eukprot:gene138-3529_t